MQFYNIIILEFDKILTIKIIEIFDKKNRKYIILIAIDIYSININILDIKLVIYHDILINSNVII